jgi:hypothetical protein
MKNEDEELGRWRAEWQALGGKDDLATKLVARAVSDGRRLRRNAAVEVLASACVISFFVWRVLRSHGSPQDVVLTALISLFIGAWLTHFFTVRADLFGSSAEGVEAFIALTRRRLGAELKWARAARRWTLALSVLLLPWEVWMFLAHQDFYAAAPWRAVVGFGGIAVILACVYVGTLRKERKLRAEEEAFERNVTDVELA